jgi:hypothetical protein
MTTIEFIIECRWCDKVGGNCKECIDFHCRSCEGCGEDEDEDGNLFCYEDLKETEDEDGEFIEYYCKECFKKECRFQEKGECKGFHSNCQCLNCCKYFDFKNNKK